MATSRCDRAQGRAGVAAALLAAGLVSSCARTPRLIEKRVGDRVIVTRAVPAAAYAHVARAELYLHHGRPGDAAVELQRALGHDHDAPELHARLAEVLLALDRLEEAEQSVRRSLAIEPTCPGLRARGRLLTARGELRAAVLAFKEALRLTDPRDEPELAAAAWLDLAQAQLLALEPTAARTSLATLIARLPGQSEARYRLAALAWALGDLGEALRQLDELKASAPDFLDPQLVRAWLLVALGDDARAEQAFRELLERSGDDYTVASAYAGWLAGRGELRRARTYAEQRLRGDDDPETLLDRIELARAARAYPLALELTRGEPTSGSDDIRPESAARRRVEVALAEAAVLEDDRRPVQALAALEAAEQRVAAGAATPSTLAWARHELGLAQVTCLVKLGRLEEARRRLHALPPWAPPAPRAGGGADGSAGPRDGAAPASSPSADDAGARAARLRVARSWADLEQRAGDPARAQAHLNRFEREQGPGLDRDLRVSLFIARAELADRSGDWRAALALAEQALALRPDSTLALNFAAFVAAEHGHQLDRALDRARAAAAQRPASGAILDTVGWALFARGARAEATAFLRQAARLAPDEPEILAHLASAHLAAGARDDALALLRRALPLAEDERLRARIEDALRAAEAAQSAGTAPGVR